MTLTVGELDRMPARAAEQALEACCGSRAWIAGMMARRPFASLEGVLSASDEVAGGLGAADWLEAFSHHPRIGEQRAKAAVPPGARAWSSSEQAAAAASPDATRARLADANREYEERFGFIFIIFASGRSAGEILDELERRLGNDREREITIAAAEQRKITRLRLTRLLSTDMELTR